MVFYVFLKNSKCSLDRWFLPFFFYSSLSLHIERKLVSLRTNGVGYMLNMYVIYIISDHLQWCGSGESGVLQPT